MKMHFSQLRFKPSKVPLFEATVEGQQVALTRNQYREKYPDQSQPHTISSNTTARVAHKLRRRFSKRYRDYLDYNSKVNKCHCREPIDESAWKEIPLRKIPKLTSTIDALVDAHFDLVLLEGDAKLPVAVEELNSEHSDEEFFFKYLNQKTVEDAACEEQDRLYEANRKKLEANQKQKLYMHQY